MKFHRFLLILFCAFVIVIICTNTGFAQDTPEWYDELNYFQETLSLDWKQRAFQIGITLFLLLATIDLIIFGIGLKFSEASIDPFTTIIKKVIVLTFLFAVLVLFYFLEYLVIGFQEFAFYVYGAELDLNEFRILAMGWWFFDTARTAIESNTSWYNVVSMSTFATLFFLIFALAGFVIMAIQYAYITLEVILALTFSPLFLGFLPMKLTRPYSERYISYIFHLGVKVFLFYTIVYFFWTILMQLAHNVVAQGDFGWHDLLSIGFFSFLGVTVLAKIPSKIAQFITENQNIDLGRIFNRVDEL